MRIHVLLMLASIPLLAGAASAQADTADLRLVKHDFEPHEAIEAGDPLSYVLNVTNLGPGRATGLVLVDRYPASFEIVSLPDECEATAPGVITCEFIAVGPGDFFAHTLTFRPTVAGTFVNRAELTAATPDPNLANNADDEETTVGSGAPTDVACRADESGIHLSWRGRVGAEFRIYRAEGGGEFVLHATTRGSSHLDADVAPNATYRYQVSTVYGGVESARSATCMATAVPFFGGPFALVLASAGCVGAYVLLRRRNA